MPRQFENWLAMTVVFGDFSTDSAAYRIEKFVIAKPEGLWQSASPAFEKCHCPEGNHRDKPEFDKHKKAVGDGLFALFVLC